MAFLPLLTLPVVGSHRIVFDASSSGCLTQYPASFNLLSAILLDNLGRLPYKSMLVLCSFQLTFNAILNMRVYVPSKDFSIAFVSVHVLQPYNRTDSTVAVNSLVLILFGSEDFHRNESFACILFTSSSLIMRPEFEI